jgi:hypothetical protein
MAYLGARIQFVEVVILSDQWYNNMIIVRVSGKHVKALAKGDDSERVDQTGRPAMVGWRVHFRLPDSCDGYHRP